MRAQTLVLATVFLLGGSPSLFAGSHKWAGRGEIHINKITPSADSHGVRLLTFYLKTPLHLLDGRPVEVGFHHQGQTSYRRRVYPPQQQNETSPWYSRVASRFLDAKDYFQLPLLISSDFEVHSYRGAFYVRTEKGTTYWTKAGPEWGQDFVFDAKTVADVAAAFSKHFHNGGAAHSSGPHFGVPTQRADMRYFNPAGGE
ncbi:MAG: hypothetical protein H6707_00950 [Deltaproteobacteria bacterium]|nr:hypothetical protein [Deltaproteobacteria bacterium]